MLGLFGSEWCHHYGHISGRINTTNREWEKYIECHKALKKRWKIVQCSVILVCDNVLYLETVIEYEVVWIMDLGHIKSLYKDYMHDIRRQYTNKQKNEKENGK